MINWICEQVILKKKKLLKREDGEMHHHTKIKPIFEIKRKIFDNFITVAHLRWKTKQLNADAVYLTINRR